MAEFQARNSAIIFALQKFYRTAILKNRNTASDWEAVKSIIYLLRQKSHSNALLCPPESIASPVNAIEIPFSAMDFSVDAIEFSVDAIEIPKG